MNIQEAQILYCMNCEDTVMVNQDGWHGVMVGNDNFLICHGPFTQNEPPVLPEYWEDDLVEPSEDELAQMDANAKELLLSLE